MSYYVSLFHGRKHPREQLPDWGFDGPILGPFDYVSWTYGNLRFGNSKGGDLELSQLLPKDEQLIRLGPGAYYGDFCLYTEAEAQAELHRRPLLNLKQVRQLLEENPCPNSDAPTPTTFRATLTSPSKPRATRKRKPSSRPR